MTHYSVGIVDDHPIPRAGLVEILKRDPSIAPLVEVASLKELRARARGAVDVILMDVGAVTLSAAFACAGIVARSPRTRVIALQSPLDIDSALPMLRAGARGYLSKDISAAEFCEAVHEVLSGAIVISPAIHEEIVRIAIDSRASRRECPTDDELAVLRLLADGFSIRDIARTLQIPQGTAKIRMSRAVRKLRARDRAQAVANALRRGFLA